MLYPVWIDWALVIIFGLMLGSFTSCLVYRLPRDLPMWERLKSKTDTRYSFCPQCHHRLHRWDLIPVLSWVCLGGKCRYCRTPISALYPSIELTTVLFCLVNFYFWQEWNPLTILLMATAPVAVGLFYIDALWRLLPDKLNLILALFGLVWIALTPVTLFNSALSAAILGGSFWGLRYLFWRWRHVEAMGLGDVKFVAAAGLWLGTGPISLFLFLCGGVGIVYALIYRLVTKEKLFPFGPALIISWWICLLLPYTFLKNFLTPLLLP